jgi:hypothetical protein
MERAEHIHIISAGEKIHVAYPAAFRELPTISRTIVFTDSAVHEVSPDPVTEKNRHEVRKAVAAVQEISASLSIPCSREVIIPPAYASVQARLAKIRREFPDARFTFDLSGGSKALCMALFAFAPWLGGEMYASFDEKAARRVPLPDRAVSSLLVNPNYQTILAMLLRSRNAIAKNPGSSWASREYLYKQLFSVYVPTRTKKAKPDDPLKPAIHYKRGQKPAAALSHATFSGFMRTLRNAGLIKESSKNTRTGIMYCITGSGEIAFRFFSNPATSSLVKMMLESD